MRKIPQKDIHPLLLNLLSVFKTYMDENGIPFFLADGTLLGAVRHKGFIPWDDDIDLCLKKTDYDHLLLKIHDNPFLDKDHRYECLSPATERNFYPIIKVIDHSTVLFERNINKKYVSGIYLDLFCMDYWPDSMEESREVFHRQRLYTRMTELVACGNLKDTKYKILYPFILPAKTVLLLMKKDAAFWGRKLLSLAEFTDTSFIGKLCFADNLKDRYPKEWFSNSTEVEFEGMTFLAPGEYDKVLTQFYGDYMKLPPEKDRIRHDFDAYYID